MHLGVVRSIHAHARVLGIDGTTARARPGTIAVWSAADLPEVTRPMPAAFGAARKGRPYSVPVLAGDVARWVGQPVAVVVADDPYRLADALEAVRVTYEPLPAGGVDRGRRQGRAPRPS